MCEIALGTVLYHMALTISTKTVGFGVINIFSLHVISVYYLFLEFEIQRRKLLYKGTSRDYHHNGIGRRRNVTFTRETRKWDNIS